LLNPNLISSIEGNFKNKIKNISKKGKNLPNQIDCIVFENEEGAYKWIELKHTGENKGIGTVRWTGTQKERFEIKQGKSSVNIQVLDFVKNEGNLPSPIKSKLGSTFPVTNLGRLLDDPDVRNSLGIEIERGIVKTILPKEEAIRGLGKIVTDIATRKINVKDIYLKRDRLKYLDNLEEDELPDLKKKVKTRWSLSKPPKDSLKESTKSQKASTLSRNSIIPKNLRIDIENDRVNDIFGELRRLYIKNFPNAGSILLRVFLELSLDHYITENSSLGLTMDDKLSWKVQKIAKHFEETGKLTKQQVKPINVCATSQNSIFSVHTLHAFVHNIHMYPNPGDLKTVWSNIEPFIRAIWE
jgi:hypothetical protein